MTTHTAIASAAQPTQREQEYLKHPAIYQTVNELSQAWAIVAERFGDTLALSDPHAKPNMSF